MSLFVDGFSRVSSKESKEDILVGVMDIANLMIHVEQVEEENLRDKEEFKKKRAKTLGMSLGSKRVMQTSILSNRRKKDLLYHLLVHLHQGTKYVYNSQNSQNFRARPPYFQESMA